MTSTSGPYDLFSEDRNKPLGAGYLAAPVSLTVDDQMTSSGGPYDFLSGDRNKLITVGYLAAAVSKTRRPALEGHMIYSQGTGINP